MHKSETEHLVSQLLGYVSAMAPKSSFFTKKVLIKIRLQQSLKLVEEAESGTEMNLTLMQQGRMSPS
jgi:hypothetical protein